MKKSQLGINSVSTRHANIEEALAAYSGAGFTNVEFVIPHLKKYLADGGHTVAEFKRALDSRGLRCIGGFECQLEAFSAPEERAKNHALIVENARLLAGLGARAMVVGTDGPPDDTVADPIGILAEAFASVAEAAKDTGVALCIEFNWSPIIKSVKGAFDLAKRSGATNVGILFDPAHYHCTSSKFEQLTPEAVSFIKHVHVNDMRDKPGELSNCNSDRALPGQGCLDLKALFGRLEEFGYDGYFSIEMFSDELWALPAAESAKLMYDSMLPLCADGA